MRPIRMLGVSLLALGIAASAGCTSGVVAPNVSTSPAASGAGTSVSPGGTASATASGSPVAGASPSGSAAATSGATTAPATTPKTGTTAAPTTAPTAKATLPIILRTLPPVSICGLYTPPLAPLPTPASGSGVIRVFVICDTNKNGNPNGKADSNEGPIPGVLVTMRCSAPNAIYTSQTTSLDGSATFYGLEGKDCTLTASKSGWFMSSMFPNLSLPPHWSQVSAGVTYFELFMSPS